MSITIDGVEYASLAAAARAVDTAPRTLRRRLKQRGKGPYTMEDLRKDGRAGLGPLMRDKLANHDRRARLREAMKAKDFSPAAFARGEGVSRQNIHRLAELLRQQDAEGAN